MPPIASQARRQRRYHAPVVEWCRSNPGGSMQRWSATVRACVAGLALVGASSAPGDELRTISVVTPGTPARWSAASGGLMQLVDPFGDEDKALQLKRMAREDSFDLAKRMQQHVLEALAKRERVALPLVISRPAELSPAPLSRDRLPETALPGSLLDVSVEWFGLYRPGAFDAYKPMVSVSYRLVDARGGLARSSRRIYYNVASGNRAGGGEVIDADTECVWKTFEELPRGRPRLWGCMDVALERIAERIAERVAPAP
jgi:hypothetical protein